MDSLLEHRGLRRYCRNILLSQKRYGEAEDLSDETYQEFLDDVGEDMLKRWYVNEVIDLETFEALLDRKYAQETI